MKGYEAGPNPEINFGYLLNLLDRLRKNNFSTPEEGRELADAIIRGVDEGIATWKSLKTNSEELDRLASGDKENSSSSSKYAGNYVDDGMAAFYRAIKEQEAGFDERMRGQIAEIRQGDDYWGVARIKGFIREILERVNKKLTTWENLGTTEEELKAFANAKIKRKK